MNVHRNETLGSRTVIIISNSSARISIVIYGLLFEIYKLNVRLLKKWGRCVFVNLCGGHEIQNVCMCPKKIKIKTQQSELV